MKTRKISVSCLCFAALVTVAVNGRAEVSNEEAGKLGKTLTLFGAEAGGNADESIPPYTGGLTKPPPGFVPGSGRYVDPFPGEKPVAVIDAKNMAQYADKLTDGTKELMRRHDSFRVDVYPTHRSIAYPKHVLDHCVKNASTAKLTASGNGVAGNPYGCVPFPIPRNGLEAIWNHQLRYFPGGQGIDIHMQGWLVDASGRRIDSGGYFAPYYNAYSDPSKSSMDDLFTFSAIGDFTNPPSQAGEKQLLRYSIDYDKQDSRVWVYTPGQRRVRLAPEFGYDTPIASTGGVQFYDEVYLFIGKPDRFDWKLVGKKEMYVPYNAYALGFEVPPEKTVTPKHLNPDHVRWEKHRVWVVEATLKPGMRHAHQRRVFYIDEDSWTIVAYDGYDAANKLARVAYSFPVPLYDAATAVLPYVIYDLNKGAYLIPVTFSSPRNYVRPAALDTSMYRQERLVGSAVR